MQIGVRDEIGVRFSSHPRLPATGENLVTQNSDLPELSVKVENEAIIGV